MTKETAVRRITIGLLLAALVASGCQGEVGKELGEGLLDPSGTAATGPGVEGTPGSTTGTNGATPAFETEDADPGTRGDRPLAIGTEAVLDDWTVAVVGYDPDATEEVVAFNSRNEPPEEGHVFAMARLEATWNGSGSKNAFLALEWALVDDTGNHWTDDGCGVLPDDLASQSDVPSGGTVAGTICFVTAKSALDQVVLYVAPLMAAPEARRWWRAPPAGAGTVTAPSPSPSSTP